MDKERLIQELQLMEARWIQQLASINARCFRLEKLCLTPAGQDNWDDWQRSESSQTRLSGNLSEIQELITKAKEPT